MWQRFTERARRVILNAQEEALKRNSASVDTEHLLLGLMREKEGVAASIFSAKGVDLARVRLEIDKLAPPSVDEATGEPKLTSRAKRVLELAADEARRLRHNYIGTEHLLLALLREKRGVAAKVLNILEFEVEATRAQVAEGAFVDEAAPRTSASKPIRANPEDFEFECFDVFGEAMKLAQASGSGVKSEHLLLALMKHRSAMLAETLDLKEPDWDKAHARLDLHVHRYNQAMARNEDEEGQST